MPPSRVGEARRGAVPRPTFARIDLDALMHNVKALRGLIGPRRICAAVKADAYGHGAPAVATAMSVAGVSMFGVAMTEEAIELREAGIRQPVILLTTVPYEDMDQILDYGITACITDEPFAQRLSETARRRGRPVEAHVKVDTGMNRVGIAYHHAAETILRIGRLPGIRITGIFSHFACSDSEDLSACHEQLRLFRQVTEALKASRFAMPMLHMANSAATLRLPEAHMDCVRPGLIFYGLRPRTVVDPPIPLKPVMSLHTRLVFCKRVPAGTKLGYGHTFTTWRESVIATLPIGYHDGYVRQYSNAGEVLIRGFRAPAVGRVCMDQTLVDATDVPGVQVGDEVVIYGEQSGRRISIEEMAARLERIPYELTCAVGGRVRRQYVLNGMVVGETPMRSLVPTSMLRQIFSGVPGAAADERLEGQRAQRGAA